LGLVDSTAALRALAAKLLHYFIRFMPVAIKRNLKRWLGLPLTRLHDDWRILDPIGPVNRPHVLLDIGAHHGWFFHCWQDWCPNAEVHAFEPYKESLAQAEKLYGSDPRVHFHPIGVGDQEKTLNLHVMADSKVSNSFLKHDARTWEQICFQTGEISKTAVEMTTLDCFGKKYGLDSIYLMKIDVQGYELKVLQGAAKMLKNTEHILVESAIQPLYRGAPKFTEVANFLNDKGFHLIGMQAWHRGNHVLMEADMLFRRNDLMPPVDRSIQRMTQSMVNVLGVKHKKT
jgi:FkbM family methyltransferase